MTENKNNDKDKGIFRDYENCDPKVKELYKIQREKQTLPYAMRMIKKYCRFKNKATFWELFDKVKIRDVSDPDISLPNYHHLFQTAEGIRKDGHPEWMQVVGLIHDLGKVIYLNGCDEDGTSESTQWGLVGDTFILGCPIPNTIIFPEFSSLSNSKYKHNYGLYYPQCGLDFTLCSWGHDEYLYRMLRHNKIPLPEEAYYMIRYHSLYLWHSNNEYEHLENEKDRQMKPHVQLFNKYDLYTKTDTPLDLPKLREYYDRLIKKFFPDVLEW